MGLSIIVTRERESFFYGSDIDNPKILLKLNERVYMEDFSIELQYEDGKFLLSYYYKNGKLNYRYPPKENGKHILGAKGKGYITGATKSQDLYAGDLFPARMLFEIEKKEGGVNVQGVFLDKGVVAGPLMASHERRAYIYITEEDMRPCLYFTDKLGHPEDQEYLLEILKDGKYLLDLSEKDICCSILTSIKITECKEKSKFLISALKEAKEIAEKSIPEVSSSSVGYGGDRELTSEEEKMKDFSNELG